MNRILSLLLLVGGCFAVFASNVEAGYIDGMSQYRGYFAPSGVDPRGTEKIKCRCSNGGNWFQGITTVGDFYRTHSMTVECGNQTPEKCCRAKCDANKNNGPNNITLYYVGFEYVEPVSVNIHVYTWPGSGIQPPAIHENVRQANQILASTAVVLNVETRQFVGRVQPPKDLAYDKDHPVHRFIDSDPSEIQVHILQTVRAAGDIGHGFKHNGAVLLADSAFERDGQTLAHEIGHYFGLEHEGHGNGDLMQEGPNLGKRLTQQDIIKLRESAVEANLRQQNGERSPFSYDPNPDCGPVIRGR